MKTIVGIMLALSLTACASTQLSPLEKKRQDIKKCTVEFLSYEATVKEASNACISIYRSPSRQRAK